MYKFFITFFIFLILKKIIIKYFINDDIKNKLYLDITEKKASSFLIGLDFIIVPALILIFEQRYMQNILLLYFVIMSLIIGCFMIIRNNVYNKKINDRIIFGNDYYYIDFVFKSSFLNMITFIIYSNIINDNPLFMFLNIVYIIIFIVSLFPDKFSDFGYYDFKIKKNYFNLKFFLMSFMIIPIIIKIVFVCFKI